MIKKKELLERIEYLEQENYKFNKFLKDNYEYSKEYTLKPTRCYDFDGCNIEDMFTYVPKLKDELDKLHQEVIAFKSAFDKHKQEPIRDFGGEIEELKKSIETLANSIQPLLVAQVEKDLAEFGKILSEIFKGEPKKKITKKKVAEKETKTENTGKTKSKKESK